MEISASRHLQSWLYESSIGLAFTTYQTNRLFLIGLKDDGRLSIFERHFDRPMGLSADGDRLLMTTRWQLWELANALPEGEKHEGYDRVYVPRTGHTIGDVDAHDVAYDADGRIVFVNTLYSCLAAVSRDSSFAPIWQPSFISKLAPEDRCHLNGLGLADGRPAYVTTVSRSDVAAGWRQRRHTGGCVIDVEDDEIVLDSLSMPHSPRIHRDRLWLANSGDGEIGYVDRAAGRFEPVAFCPGYARGLAFHGDYAIVGLSKQRRERAFSGLALDGKLREKDAEARCGIWVVDLRTGAIAHWLEIEGTIIELYDVAVLPGVRRPMALGFKSDEIQRLLTIGTSPRPTWEALSAAASSTSPASGAPGAAEAKVAASEYRLGNQLAKAGHFVDAVGHYESALRADPRHVNARINLGTSHHRLGDTEAALRCYREAAAIDPQSVRALSNLGMVLAQRSELREAIECYDAARRLEPGNLTVLRELASLLCSTGDWPAARKCLEALVEAEPGNAAGYNSLGALYLLEGHPNEALPLFERALAIDPDLREAHVNVGNIHEGAGDLDAARDSLGRALAIRDDVPLTLHRELLAPPVLDSIEQRDQLREHAGAVIERFRGREFRFPLLEVPASRAEVPFNWSYYGGNDLALRTAYAQLFEPSFPVEPSNRPRSDGPWRVGFVVTATHEGVFLRCMAGIVDRLDRSRFRPAVLCPEPGISRVRKTLRNHETDFVTLPNRFDHALATLRNGRFDLLYFWEVGTDSTNYFLPFSRLAPVQCTGWGWPVSSGAPEIDYHVTSESLAPPGADELFREPLARLPHLPAYAMDPKRQPPARSPDAFGLPTGANIYLCVQNPRKVHPDFDEALAAILLGDPAGVAVFVNDKSPLFGEILRRRWQRTVPDVGERLVLLDHLPPDDYICLVASAHVVLDTFHFGGSNTAYDCIGAAVPVVTLPGGAPASRYTAALYEIMDIDDTIASSPQDFAARAVSIATNESLRRDLVERIVERRSAVFRDAAAVSALEAFFQKVLAADRS